MIANGAQSVETDSILPDKFCERGGQMIFVQLNVGVEKCSMFFFKVSNHNF
jgi:hypothetical protein